MKVGRPAKGPLARTASPVVASKLTSRATSGARLLKVASTDGFIVGRSIVIEPGTRVQEGNIVVGFGSLRLQSPLQFDHAVNAVVVMPMAGGGAADAPPGASSDSAMFQKFV